ncbi:putative structural protein P68 [Antheraea assamensis cypovirus 4]|uniref:Structural protein P68 n=1 Tax=Antheraea assamensis cypovirus 4 TaxID=180166 RepID=A0AAE9N5U3_9REOV|nr:putative structural protein P68 [Antheraea assamensis cypovirus 4]WPN08786.1 P68 viral structural protein [Cypovirus 4]
MEAVIHDTKNDTIRRPLGLYYLPNSLRPHNAYQIKTREKKITKASNLALPAGISYSESYINVIPVTAQNQLHRRLEKIYTRNNGSYQNPKLIAQCLLNGLEPTYIANARKRLTAKSSTEPVRIGRLTRNSLKNRNHITSFADAEDIEVTSQLLNELEELNSLRLTIRGVIPIVIINSKTYRLAIPTYLTSLLKFSVQYTVNPHQGAFDTTDPYLGLIYRPIIKIDSLQYPGLKDIKNKVFQPSGGIDQKVLQRSIDKSNILLPPQYTSVLVEAYGDDDFIELLHSFEARILTRGLDKPIRVGDSGGSILKHIMRYGDMELFPKTLADAHLGPLYPSNNYIVTQVGGYYKLPEVKEQYEMLEMFFDRAKANGGLKVESEHVNGWPKGSLNQLHVTGGKALGKTTLIDEFKLVFKDLGLECDYIDSDDYGFWLMDMLGKPFDGELPELPTVTVENVKRKAKVSYLHTVAAYMRKELKLRRSFDILDAVSSNKMAEYFKQFIDLTKACFQRGDGSLHNYITIRRSLAMTKNIVSTSHHILESVHTAFTNINFRLCAPWSSMNGVMSRKYGNGEQESLNEMLLASMYTFGQTSDVLPFSVSTLCAWHLDRL